MDNLITLSGMLDVSFDKLITGEPSTYFLFYYRKLKSKRALYLIFMMTIADSS